MKRFLLFVALIIVLNLTVGVWISDRVHKWGQTGQTAHDVVMTFDLADFWLTGGGFTGASHNYFGWVYARAASNPNRPWWKKALFWQNPYYLTETPKEWPYPLRR